MVNIFRLRYADLSPNTMNMITFRGPTSLLNLEVVLSFSIQCNYVV